MEASMYSGKQKNSWHPWATFLWTQTVHTLNGSLLKKTLVYSAYCAIMLTLSDLTFSVLLQSIVLQCWVISGNIPQTIGQPWCDTVTSALTHCPLAFTLAVTVRWTAASPGTGDAACSGARVLFGVKRRPIHLYFGDYSISFGINPEPRQPKEADRGSSWLCECQRRYRVRTHFRQGYHSPLILTSSLVCSPVKWPVTSLQPPSSLWFHSYWSKGSQFIYLTICILF